MSRLYIISILFLFFISLNQFSFLLLILTTPLLPVIANTINFYDKIKNKNFIRKARKRLKYSNTKIIAITGSNGKTSVKNILLKILSTKYKTQATPSSFNTPLGIAKFINNELKHETQFLILEYGARHKNDIKKLCNLYGADYGIITTISSQHIESFHSVENVFKAKNELCNFLQNKPCVFNIDNLYCLRSFKKKSGIALSSSIKNKAHVFAINIKFTSYKTNFKLSLNNKLYMINTKLLGEHNISNICLATTLASQLNVEDENIVSIIKCLEPTEHRLSLIKTRINILDDTYNCSTDSAKQALNVLKSFHGSKMIATPGIIECGKEKYKINFNLGKQLACFDYIVIIGNENKQAIADGIKKEIKEKNLQPQIYFSPSLENAKQYFTKLNDNDTLLLLNDLPDDYN